MPSDFRQTESALREDRLRGRRVLCMLLIMGTLLGLAATWAIVARIPVYAVSQFARLQTRDAVHPVDTLVSGRVTAVYLPIGAQVRRGDVLLDLDATDVDLQLEEARATARGLAAQLTALHAEIAARETAMLTIGKLGKASLSEAQAARSKSEAEALFATRERERTDRALTNGVVPKAEADRANTDVVQKQAEVSARAHRLSVLSSETQRDLADRRAHNESLRRSLAELLAARDRADVQVRRLEVERARHTMRAPIDGLLGQIRAPQVGSMVTANQTIAVVTPETAVAIRAEFAPAAVVGLVHAGQRAHMRVTAFPWTLYGVLDATVTAVSSEVTDGRIQVELALDDSGDSRIPRHHGLVGEVEVEIEQLAPGTLLARAAGYLFAANLPP